MAVVTFKKKIAKPQTVLPKNPLGQRKVEHITPERLRKIADSGNKMLADGLLIPAPYGHTDDNGVYPLPLVRSTSGALVDAKTGEQSRWDHAVNSGFWTGFEIDPQDNGLIGYLEAEGDVNDENTHAGRIGKTFRQTSPFFVDWLDGSNVKREEAPLHICVTNRAVQNGQDNFELVKVTDKNVIVPDEERIAKSGLTHPELAIAMALDPLELSLDGSNDDVVKEGPISPGMVGRIKALLKEKLDILLGDDTNSENIVDRIVTVLYNMKPIEEGDEAGLAPDGSRILSPTIMSLDNANPDDINLLKKQNQSLLGMATTSVKTRITERITKLQKAGKIGKTYAENKLNEVGAVALSLDDWDAEAGKVKKLPIELALDEIEAAAGVSVMDPPTKVKEGEVEGFVPQEPDDMGDDPKNVKPASEEDVQDFFKQTVGR